jgi:hypothetical protein
MAAIRDGRMNSMQQPHEIRLRGLRGKALARHLSVIPKEAPRDPCPCRSHVRRLRNLLARSGTVLASRISPVRLHPGSAPLVSARNEPHHSIVRGGCARIPPTALASLSIIRLSMMIVRLLIITLCACVAVESASAQKLAFHGIAWGMPADSVRAPLRALGFTFRQETGDGDHEFRREDGAVLYAGLRQGRVVAFTLFDGVRGEGADARFTALADSLQAELGEPDDVVAEGTQQMRRWEAGFSAVTVETSRFAGQRAVELGWHGPGWFDEIDRRNGHLPQPAGFTTVLISPFLRIGVDTTVHGPRTAGAMRGRFRIEYFQPITPTLEGVEQDPLDTVEYEMEFDCAGRRTRLIARSTYLEGRRQASNRPQGQPWTTPRQPDGHYARGLDVVCRAARPVR